MSERQFDPSKYAISFELAKSTEEFDGLEALDRVAKVLRLYVSEVRRLRSDDWLADAATNIADEAHRVVGGTLYAEDILRILKKHRG